MLALLPLVTLPFDWASLGATRALLRRGCESHGPFWLRSPTLLGVADLVIGMVLSGLLALALIVALVGADALVVLAGRAPVIEAGNLLRLIDEHPGDPAHYWVYFTLLSTLLPSFVNALIGVLSLLTFSLPAARRWLIATIPTCHEPGRSGTRYLTVVMLSAHWSFGTFLTGAGLWGLWQAVLLVPDAQGHLMRPLIGFAQWCGRAMGVPS